MENINKSEVERRIGYCHHLLSKIESDMLKMQSERVEVKHKLVHLRNLQQQVKLIS